jgi:hypothetical protein
VTCAELLIHCQGIFVFSMYISIYLVFSNFSASPAFFDKPTQPNRHRKSFLTTLSCQNWHFNTKNLIFRKQNQIDRALAGFWPLHIFTKGDRKVNDVQRHTLRTTRSLCLISTSSPEEAFDARYQSKHFTPRWHVAPHKSSP